MLFEINAAFDHLSRIWAYEESEPEVVAKAYSHLKRSCLDIFKLAAKEARSQFDELRLTDTGVIDNGEFDRRLLELWQRIKSNGRAARVNEGDPRKDDASAIHAFNLWLPVYEDCVTLENDFYNHAQIDWARKREGRSKWIERGIAFGLGIVASLGAAGLWCVGSNMYAHYTAAPAVT